MDERDPFEILGVQPSTDWYGVRTAYEMLVGQLGDLEDADEQKPALSEIEWAYEELKDPRLRSAYAERNRGLMVEDQEETDTGREVGGNPGQTGKSKYVSAMVYFGPTMVMLSAVVYGLYLLGALRPAEGIGMRVDVVPTASHAKSMEPVVKLTPGGEAHGVAHTATVEALHSTATMGALFDYTDGLTATIDAARAALTPTPVQFSACPNVASVNVRTGPGTAYKPIGYILQGDCVVVTGRSNDSDWLVIINAPRPSSDGGWVAGSLMDIEGEVPELTVVISE